MDRSRLRLEWFLGVRSGFRGALVRSFPGSGPHCVKHLDQPEPSDKTNSPPARTIGTAPASSVAREDQAATAIPKRSGPTPSAIHHHDTSHETHAKLRLDRRYRNRPHRISELLCDQPHAGFLQGLEKLRHQHEQVLSLKRATGSARQTSGKGLKRMENRLSLNANDRVRRP